MVFYFSKVIWKIVIVNNYLKNIQKQTVYSYPIYHYNMENSNLDVLINNVKREDSQITDEEWLNNSTDSSDINVEPLENFIIKIEPQNCEPQLTDNNVKTEPIGYEPDLQATEQDKTILIDDRSNIEDFTCTESTTNKDLIKPKKIHQCDLCPYTTTRRYDLLKHFPIHKGEGRYKCEYCPRAFNQKSGLDSHLLMNHKNLIPDINEVITSKIHSCPMCSYQSIRASDMKSHMFVHEKGQDREKYSCDLCSYESYRKNDIKRHLGRHISDRKFVCDVCQRGFREELFLDSHRLTVHKTEESELGRKVHKCPQCPFKAVIMTQFKRHMMAQHSDSKPFMCAACGAGFNLKKLLDNHILRNHQEHSAMMTISNKIHTCTFCEYRTIRKGTLKNHMKRNHTSELVIL